MEIIVEKLKTEDIKPAKQLVAEVIQDSFLGEGVDIQQFRRELLREIFSVQRKFDHVQEGSYSFFVAKQGEEVIGTAGLGLIGKPIQLALEQLHLSGNSIVELLSFYVKPTWQSRGVGTQLLQVILQSLSGTTHDRFALSTGYQKSKSYWSKKMGEPSVVLPNYYGAADCWVWIKETIKLGGGV